MSSASDIFTGNPQGVKKGKDENKDLLVLLNERLAKINNSMTTLTGRVNDMEKRLKELESMEDFGELRGELQVQSMVADVNKKIQALRASEAIKDAELQA